MLRSKKFRLVSRVIEAGENAFYIAILSDI